MGKNRQSGFTLIELMITLVIVGILIQVVAPGFQKMIKDNRVRGEVFALRAAITTARSEAVTRRAWVVICPGTPADGCGGVDADWTDGVIAFVDSDADNDYTVPTAVDEDHLILSHFDETPAYLTAWLDDTAGNAFIEFSPSGFATSTASIEVCDDRELTDASGIIVSAIGYVSVALDSAADADEILNDHGGNNFDCDEPAPP